MAKRNSELMSKNFPARTVHRRPRTTAAIQQALLSRAAGNRREFPWRDEGISPYRILIAEILMKRMTARRGARIRPLYR